MAREAAAMPLAMVPNVAAILVGDVWMNGGICVEAKERVGERNMFDVVLRMILQHGESQQQ